MAPDLGDHFFGERIDERRFHLRTEVFPGRERGFKFGSVEGLLTHVPRLVRINVRMHG